MKRIATVIIIIALSCTLTLSINNDWENVQPDTGQRFRIWRSLSMTGGDYTECNIWVIQCTTDTDLENIFEEIRAFHDNMNGVHDELVVHLFRSKVDMENYNELATMTFYKDKTDSEDESFYN